MTQRDMEIVNRLGLHARAAAKMVQTAGRFTSNVTLVKDGEAVDAKSILGIMALGAAQGSKLTVICEGSDEEAASQAIVELVADRFGEEA
ncbi:MAG: HPr family phosphocarrier protein [Acidobacteriota bacterium]